MFGKVVGVYQDFRGSKRDFKDEPVNYFFQLRLKG